jgi:hypothetical protein
VARACFREALAGAQALGHLDGVACALDGLGAVAARLGAWERAARLAGSTQAFYEAIGYELEPTDRAFRDRYLTGLLTVSRQTRPGILPASRTREGCQAADHPPTGSSTRWGLSVRGSSSAPPSRMADPA